MLDLSEEDAIKQFEVLLNDTSYLTVVFDRIHDWYDCFDLIGHLLIGCAGHNIYEIDPIGKDTICLVDLEIVCLF